MSCYELPNKFAFIPGFVFMGKLRSRSPAVNSHYSLLTPHGDSALKGADSQQCRWQQIRVLGPGMDHALRQMRMAVWVQPWR